MLPENYLEIILRLGLALIFGGIIGLERAGTNHDAGLRTHILVCLGSAGVMIMSEAMHLDFGGDAMRIGAQVVSGIGFLGAGCILVHGKRIRGLTTAAGLWATACLGLIVGAGYYFTGIVMVALMLAAMLVLHPVTGYLQKRANKKVCKIKIFLAQDGDVSAIYKYITDSSFNIASMSKEEDGSVIMNVVQASENTAELVISSLITDFNIKKIEKL